MSLKLVGKNTVIYTIGNVCLRAASFLIVPLYTHSLSMSDYGLLMTLLLTIQFMLTVMNCGMRPGLVRFTKIYEKDNRISELLGTSCFINVLGGLAVTGVSITFLVPFFRNVLYSEDVYTYVGLACCISLLQSLSTHMMSYYRARNQAIKFMIVGIMAAGILFVATYIFLCVLHLGIIGALLANIAAYAIILLIILFDIFRRTSIRISFSLIPKLVRFGFPLLFSMTSELIITGASIYFLSLLSGLEVVAMYSLGYKLASILPIVILLPFQLSFGPYVFENLETPNIKKKMSQLFTYLLLAILGVSFCILFSSRLVLPLIAPPEYSSAYTVTILLLPGITFWGIYYFAQTLLIAARKTYIIGLTVTICAILCVVLNYTLILPLSWYGAIIASNVSSILIGLTLLIIGIKEFPAPIEWQRICTAAGLLIFFLFIFFMVRNVNLILFSVITLSAALGSILILFSFHFFHNDEKLVIKKLILIIQRKISSNLSFITSCY